MLQIVKDDWSSSGNLATAGMGSKNHIPSSTSVRGKPQPSTIIYGFNKPAAAVAPYQQTPPKQEPQKLPFGPVAAVSDPILPKSDDFSFNPTPVVPKVKPSYSSSAAGTNIERMYKAAGFTTPPKVGAQAKTYVNIPSRNSFDKLPPSLTVKQFPS